MLADWLKPALPTLAWCALVAGGVVYLKLGGQPPEQSRAARDLPTDTLLMTGDLQQSGLTGRYIVAPNGVTQGSPVLPDDVADQPVLPAPPPVRLLLSLPVAYADIARGTNAGATVQLCGKPPLAFGPVTVTYVRCTAGGVTDCSAVVEVPPAAMADLAANGLKDTASSSELHLAPTCN